MEIKFTLITCTVIAIASVLLTYNYTSNHYEAVIAKDKIEQVIAAQETTTLVLAKERKNGNIVDGLNAKALEQSKVVANLQTKLASYRSSDGSMYIKSSGCKNSAGTSNSASGSPSTTATESSSGLCQLSGELASILNKTFRDADEMRANLLIAEEYAKSVDKQRKEMSNEQ